MLDYYNPMKNGTEETEIEERGAKGDRKYKNNNIEREEKGGWSIGGESDEEENNNNSTQQENNNSKKDKNEEKNRDRKCRENKHDKRMDQMKIATCNINRATNRKLPTLLESSEREVDIIALQETEDPPLHACQTRANNYNYLWLGSGKAKAGVALLIERKWEGYIRSWRVVEEGRVIAVVMDVNGLIINIFSVYAPTGLNYAKEEDDSMILTKNMYDEITREINKNRDSINIVMGDLNESRKSQDRETYGKQQYHDGRAVEDLIENNNMIDCFENYDRKTNYTYHRRIEGKETKSRLDYILVNGVVEHEIGKRLIVNCDFSDHKMIMTSITFHPPNIPRPNQPFQPLQLINIKGATTEKKNSFGEMLEDSMKIGIGMIAEMSEGGGRDEMDKIAETIVEVCSKTAKLIFGMTGGKKHVNKHISHLHVTRRALTRFRTLTKRILQQQSDVDGKKMRKWTKMWKAWMEEDVSNTNIDDSTEEERWGWVVEKIGKKINEIRRDIKREIKRIKKIENKEWERNQKATVHKWLNGNKTTQIQSIVHPITNTLISHPDQIKNVLKGHYEKVFEKKKEGSVEEETERREWIEKLYNKKKEGIEEKWYEELMYEFDEEEVKELCKDSAYVVAPGKDGVGAGLFRLGVERSPSFLRAITLLFNMSLRLSAFPAIGKTSIIVPILKNARLEPSVSNIRPISLQSAITKILNKGLARRLTTILARHPILHPAQFGFIKEGGAFKVADILTDVWEINQQRIKHGQMGAGCFCIFYDIKGAYDNVPHSSILSSLRWLGLPNSFVRLVEDSLTSLTSSVRTVFGLTDTFPVYKSVRQGDPLSPLLFIFVMDMLHVGLERNPLFDNIQDGFRVSDGIVVSSLGYVDDSIPVASTYQGACRQNQWVNKFCFVHSMVMNGNKSHFVGRDSNGDDIPNVDIVVGGVLVPTLPSRKSLKQLGFYVNMDLEWKEQELLITKTIQYYCKVARQNHISVSQAVTLFNVYLAPKIEYRMRFVSANQSVRKSWDSMLARCFSYLSNSSYCFKAKALAATIGLVLPSQLLSLVRISEGFIRLNGTTTWSKIAEERWNSRRGSHWCQKIKKEIDSIDWMIEKVEKKRGFKVFPHYPRSSYCVQSKEVEIEEEIIKLSVIKNGVWGSAGSFKPKRVRVYTDGSTVLPNMTDSPDQVGSAWGLCVENDELKHFWSELPTEENQYDMKNKRFSNLVLMGGKVDDINNYIAELTAIYGALVCVPLNWSIIIMTDSLSSISTINEYSSKTERQRLRSSGRPALQIITTIIKEKRKVGAVISFKYVASHREKIETKNEKGNTLADLAANHHRNNKSKTDSNCLLMHLGEERICIRDEEKKVVYNDIRRSVRDKMKRIARIEWSESSTQSNNFQSEELCHWWLKGDILAKDNLMLRIILDTFHWGYPPSSTFVPSPSFGKKLCRKCRDDRIENIHHLIICPSESFHRNNLMEKIIYFVNDYADDDSVWKMIKEDSRDGSEMLEKMFNNTTDRIKIGGWQRGELMKMIKYLKIDVDKTDIDKKNEDEDDKMKQKKKKNMKKKKKRRDNIDKFDINLRQIVYSFIEQICIDRDS